MLECVGAGRRVLLECELIDDRSRGAAELLVRTAEDDRAAGAADVVVAVREAEDVTDDVAEDAAVDAALVVAPGLSTRYAGTDRLTV